MGFADQPPQFYVPRFYVPRGMKPSKAALGGLKDLLTVNIADQERRSARERLADLAQELEAHEYFMTDDGPMKRETRIKQLKAEIQTAMNNLIAGGASGVRMGQLLVTTTEQNGKKTLDKAKLLEAGVTVQQLNAGYKTGKPFTKVSLINLDYKKDDGREEEGKEEEE